MTGNIPIWRPATLRPARSSGETALPPDCAQPSATQPSVGFGPSRAGQRRRRPAPDRLTVRESYRRTGRRRADFRDVRRVSKQVSSPSLLDGNLSGEGSCAAWPNAAPVKRHSARVWKWRCDRIWRDHEKRDFATLRPRLPFAGRNRCEGHQDDQILIVAASLGLTLSAAGACNFNRSAEADVDQTVVASVVADEAKSMSTPQTIILDEAAPTERPRKPRSSIGWLPRLAAVVQERAQARSWPDTQSILAGPGLSACRARPCRGRGSPLPPAARPDPSCAAG